MKRSILMLLLLCVPAVVAADFFNNILLTSAVVHVKLKEDDMKWHRAICSGTYISEHELVTAAHCFDSPELLIWTKDYDGTSHRAILVKINTLHDLALLYVYDSHRYTQLGEEGKLGQHVFNVGSPFGLNFLLSEGIISKLHNSLPPFTGTYTITTAMINPGSSGGGVFDTRGRLIGVNTMSIGGMFGWAGISCAVDSETIRQFLK